MGRDRQVLDIMMLLNGRLALASETFSPAELGRLGLVWAPAVGKFS